MILSFIKIMDEMMEVKKKAVQNKREAEN